MAIRLIVGLGNPGAKYEDTRHNVGFWFVDELLRAHTGRLKMESRFHGEVGSVIIGQHEVRLLKPTTFMNRSGQAVSSLAKYFSIAKDEMLIIHDELDLPAGVARLKQDGGHGGHNGLRDIISAIGGKDFYRLRIGIGHPGNKDEVVDYVLNRPSKADRASIQSALDAALDVSALLAAGEFQKAMNQLHSVS